MTKQAINKIALDLVRAETPSLPDSGHGCDDFLNQGGTPLQHKTYQLFQNEKSINYQLLYQDKIANYQLFSKENFVKIPWISC